MIYYTSEIRRYLEGRQQAPNASVDFFYMPSYSLWIIYIKGAEACCKQSISRAP